jgi:hypothetical protein
MAPANPRPPQEDGMDILKFFIAIMSFLTVLVAGLAGYNWSRATGLADEIADDQASLEAMERVAANPEFREMIAKDRANKDQVDILKKDLGQFLNDTATRMGVQLMNFEKMGAMGFRQQGYDKFSCRFVLAPPSSSATPGLPFEAAVNYLFYIQAAWPGLKIEEISTQEAPHAKKDETFPNWKTTVLVSIFRPKETAQ